VCISLCAKQYHHEQGKNRSGRRENNAFNGLREVGKACKSHLLPTHGEGVVWTAWA
jgi:hypothetical protein